MTNIRNYKLNNTLGDYPMANEIEKTIEELEVEV